MKIKSYINVFQDVRDVGQSWDVTLGPPYPYALAGQKFNSLNYQTKTDLGWVRNFTSGAVLDVSVSVIANGRNRSFAENVYTPEGLLGLSDTVDSTVREYGFNSQGKYSFPSVAQHTIDIGWDASALYRDETRIENALPIPGSDQSSSVMLFNANVNRGALYAQDDWQITPAFTLYLGLREEAVENRSAGNTFAAVSNTTQVLSPILRSLWKLSEDGQQELRVSLNRTYQPPSLYSLIPRPYLSDNNSVFDPDFSGNPNLRAELAWGADISYQHDWGKDSTASVGFFGRDIDNVIRTELALIDGRWMSTPTNDGTAKTWGVELDGKTKLSSIFANLPAVSLNSNITASWSNVSTISGPYNRLQDQIPLSATFGADYKIDDALSVGASFTYKDGAKIQTWTDFVSQSPLHRDLDVYGLWAITEKTRLRLGINNLLAQNLFAGASDYASNGVLTQHTIGVNPVSVRATLEVQY